MKSSEAKRLTWSSVLISVIVSNILNVRLFNLVLILIVVKSIAFCSIFTSILLVYFDYLRVRNMICDNDFEGSSCWRDELVTTLLHGVGRGDKVTWMLLQRLLLFVFAMYFLLKFRIQKVKRCLRHRLTPRDPARSFSERCTMNSKPRESANRKSVRFGSSSGLTKPRGQWSFNWKHCRK